MAQRRKPRKGDTREGIMGIFRYNCPATKALGRSKVKDIRKTDHPPSQDGQQVVGLVQGAGGVGPLPTTSFGGPVSACPSCP